MATPVNWKKTDDLWFTLQFPCRPFILISHCPNFQNIYTWRKYFNEFLWCQNIQSTTSSNWNKMSEWLPHRTTLDSPHCPITVIVSTGFIPKEQKGEGKEKIQSACFLNGEFQKYGQAFLLRQWLTSTRCVLPAPLPPHSPSLYLPLSRNTRHILLNTTHQPKVHFLLLGSSPSHQPYSQDMH